MRTEKEIHEQIDIASKRVEEGNLCSFLSYEEGVKAALEWILDDRVLPPFNEAFGEI